MAAPSPASAPPPARPLRNTLLRAAGAVAALLVICCLGIASVAVYRARFGPHRLAVSPTRVAPAGQLTVSGVRWGDVADDGTGKHVDIYFLGGFCQNPYPPCSFNQKERANVAADGTFTTTITLNDLIGGNRKIYVTGPDRNGPHSTTTVHIDGP